MAFAVAPPPPAPFYRRINKTQVRLSRNEQRRHIDCMEAPTDVRPVLQASGAVSDYRRFELGGPSLPQRQRKSSRAAGETKMLHYAVVFFVIAIVAAILGFGGLAAGAAGIAKILFFVFLILAVITFLRRA